MQLLVQNCLGPSRATEIFSAPKRRIFSLPKIVRYRNKSGLQYVPTLTSQTQWYYYLKDKEKILDAFQFDNWAHVFEQYHDMNETWRRWKEQFLKDVQSFIPSRSTTEAV